MTAVEARHSIATIVVSFAMLVPSAMADFELNILVTREVRGAIYPVDSRGQQCSANLSQYPADCDCFGGASRRQAYINDQTSVLGGNSGHNTLTLDTGAYFAGSGKFYPSFQGNASAEFFAAAAYDAFGLAFRDITSPGAAGLATYLARVKELRPSAPKAIITNFDTSGYAEPLGEYIQQYQILPLTDDRNLAVLSLLDPTHLVSTHPAVAVRLTDYWRALATTLATLRRLPSNDRPSVVVVIVSDVPVSEADVSAAGSRQAAVDAALHTLVDEAIGVDIFLLGGFTVTPTVPHIRRNWANDSVLIVPSGGGDLRWGKGIDNVTARFSDEGLLLEYGTGASHISIGCGAPEDTAKASELASWTASMEERMNIGIGRLSRELDSELHAAAPYAPDYSVRSVKAFNDGACATLNGSVVCGCRVGPCLQGAFIADALQWQAGTDIALINSGAIRGYLPGSIATRGDLVVMTPFANEVVRMRLSGAALRLAMQNSIARLSDPEAATSPRGNLAQVSGMKYEYYFRGGTPTLSHVYIAADGTCRSVPTTCTWNLLNDTEVYTVAMPDYIANGGDGYTVLEDVGTDVEHLGLLVADATAAFLEHEAPMDQANELWQTYAERIVQQADQVVIQIGILCKTGDTANSATTAPEREECDHMHHLIDRINDKTDGFLDDVLPSGHIELAESNIGCVNGRGSNAVTQLVAALPSMAAAVGVGCSSDVEEISRPSFRDMHNFHAVVVSGSSTAPLLADEQAFPNVARLATGEAVGGGPGNAKLAEAYGWKRVAVVHDDSTWALGAADAFISAHLGVSGAVVLNTGDPLTAGFSVETWDASPADDELPVALLRRLVELGVRIVYLATQPRFQERIFAASYREGIFYGTGHAWINGWISEDALFKPDGTVSADAVHGMEGTIGLLESVGEGTPLFESYKSHWLQHAAIAGCSAPTPYCDVDGDALTDPIGYSMGMAEAMLLVVKAFDLDDNYRDQAFFSDPARIYAAIKQLGSHPGYMGPSGSVVLDRNGDRLGVFNVKNMKLQTGESGRRLLVSSNSEEAAPDDSHVPERFRPRRELAVPLQSTSAGYANTGTWAPGDASPTVNGVTFPGNTRTAPSDTPEASPQSLSGGAIGAIIGGSLAVMLVMFVVQRVRQHQLVERQKKLTRAQKAEADAQRRSATEAKEETAKMKKELDKFKEAMTGVKAVVGDFDPRRARHVPATGDASSLHVAQVKPGAAADTSSTRPSAVAQEQMRSWATYYWNEDAGRVGAHDPAQVLQQDGRSWVRYANAVSRYVEDEHQKWLLRTSEAERQEKSVINLDLNGQISSTGTEEKAFAKDSGMKFKLDLVRWVQINVKTGYERAVLRVEQPVSNDVLEAKAELLRHQLGLTGTAEEVAKAATASLGLTHLEGQSINNRLTVCVTMVVGNPTTDAPSSSADAGRPESPGGALFRPMVNAAQAVLAMSISPFASPSETPGREGSWRGLVEPVSIAEDVPAELLGEDLLLLYTGQLLQTSKTRPDGWAFGNIMMDTVENRPNPGLEHVSTQAGWFPLANTAIANADQLSRLQKKMGDGAANALSPPSHWEQVSDPLQVEITMLPEGTEKSQVIRTFMATLPPNIAVVDVQRIQNVSMWQSYAVKRQTVLAREKDKSKSARFERVWLFHGTDEDTVPKVVQQGFNRSFCGRNATAFGKGVYFARDAAYSSSTTYSRPNAQKIQHMFLCRVVVGEYCRGVRDALTPGVRQGNQLYDSTVNQMDHPSIYVTYHDAQAYPEYLVRFRTQ